MDETGLIGRDAELLAVEALLDTAADCVALFIDGEAGIGKSTVWGLGVAAALRRGWRVLTTRGSETETGLSFAGLTDLFDLPLDEVGADLRPPQRDALELALLRQSPGPTPLGQREVCVASLALLRRLVADGPVLLALDDVQWVDHATIDAVAFALRRLAAAPVRVLAARRIGSAVAPTATEDRADLIRSALTDRVAVLELGAMDAPSIGRLLEDRVGVRLAGKELAQLVEHTNGNPFWALEIGSALGRHGGLGDPPVPESLSALVAARLAELSPDVREALLVCAALSAPPITLATAALVDIADDPIQTLDAAMTADVLHLTDARLRPAHPLLGSIALETLPPGARQRLHRRLAAIVTDPEQHARLLAACAGDEPDPDVAAALEAGATAARSRGAVNAAAQLAEQAASMTPTSAAADRARRLIAAGDLLFAGGNAPRAHRCAENALAESPTPSLRCQAGLLLATIECWADGSRGWMSHIDRAEQALRDAGDDIAMQARAHVVIADLTSAGAVAAEFHARRALELLAERRDADPATETHATLMLQVARLDMGDGLDDELLGRAAAAEARAPQVPLADRTETYRACWLKNVDDLDGSRAAVRVTIELANNEGNEGVLSNLFLNVAFIEMWAGRYPAAIAAADEAIRVGEEVDILPETAYYVRGQLAAYTGDFEWVRKHLPARLTLAIDAEVPRGIAHCRAAIGASELLEGDTAAAVDNLRNAYTSLLELGVHEPSRRLRLESDYAQALITIGALDEAAALSTELHTFGPRSKAPTTRGIALRIDGLVAAGRGDLDRAIALLEDAAQIHERSPIPLERGRTHMALGVVLRRRRIKSRAAIALREALDCFTDLGANPFIDLARAELSTLDGAPRDAILTAAEQRVADLVAHGLSNKEIAARLFVSVRTIESQLAATYRKVGVSSRAALVRLITPE